MNQTELREFSERTMKKLIADTKAGQIVWESTGDLNRRAFNTMIGERTLSVRIESTTGRCVTSLLNKDGHVRCNLPLSSLSSELYTMLRKQEQDTEHFMCNYLDGNGRRHVLTEKIPNPPAKE